MNLTSRSPRDSIGISCTPSVMTQSKVDDGSATYLQRGAAWSDASDNDNDNDNDNDSRPPLQPPVTAVGTARRTPLPLARRTVDGRAEHGHAVVLGSERFQVRPHLVAHVPCPGRGARSLSDNCSLYDCCYAIPR